MIDGTTKKLFEQVFDTMSTFFVEQVEGATPVLSFGDYTKAKIATLGINPSSLEFVDKRGKILQAPYKRLTDLETLKLPSKKHLDSQAYIDEIWEGCKNYFSTQKNPYWDWFGDLENILLHLDFSYKDGSTCHLDLFPLATQVMFSKLSESDQFVCITKFNYLLSEQLKNSQIKLILFNGATVEKSLSVIQNYDISIDSTFEYSVQGKKLNSNLYLGSTSSGQKIFGWSANLQAFRGSSAEKEYLSKKISEWLRAKID
jgi:hypothetical protein